MENEILKPENENPVELNFLVNENQEVILLSQKKGWGNWDPLFAVEGFTMWLQSYGPPMVNLNNWRKHNRNGDFFQFSQVGKVFSVKSGNMSRYVTVVDKTISSNAGCLLYGPYYYALSSGNYVCQFEFWFDDTGISYNKDEVLVTVDLAINVGAQYGRGELKGENVVNGFRVYTCNFEFSTTKELRDFEARTFWHGKGKLVAVNHTLYHVYN